MPFTIAEVLHGLRATPHVREDAPSTPVPLASSTPRFLSPTSVEERARAYIDTIHAIEEQGGNNATFRAAAALRRDFHIGDAAAWSLLHEWNRTNAHPPWTDEDLGRIFANAGKHGTHAPGAALAARPAVNEAMSEDHGVRASLIASRFRRITTSLLQQKPPVKEFLWEGAIPVGDVGTLVGPGAAGKSALMVGLAVHMALRLEYLGRKTMCRRTVIVSAEDNLDDYLRKLAGWRDVLGDRWNAERIAEYVTLLDLRGTDVRLVRPSGRDYAPAMDGRAVAEVIKDTVPDVGLVIIETVSRVGGDESNPAMSALVSACEEISAMTGASVVLVGHVSKNEAREGKGDQHAQRGGAALSDNGRFTLTATLLNGSHEKDPEAKALVAGIDPVNRGSMFILRVAKVNCAPTSTIGIVERIPSPYQTVTVALRAAGGGARVAPFTRADRLLGLRDAVAELARHGDVTKTSLTDRHLRHLGAIGITRREVGPLLKAAVSEGLLVEVPRNAQGGGTRFLPVMVGDGGVR